MVVIPKVFRILLEVGQEYVPKHRSSVTNHQNTLRTGSNLRNAQPRLRALVVNITGHHTPMVEAKTTEVGNQFLNE